MTQQPVGDAVPAFLYRGDAEALQAWLAALPGLSDPAAAVRERPEIAAPDAGRPWRHKPPPTHW